MCMFFAFLSGNSSLATPLDRRSGTIHEDVTTEVLGKIGAWQWTVTILSTILAAPTVLNQYEDAFLLQPPNGVVCVTQYNATLCSYSVNGTEFMCDSWKVRFMWLVWIKKTVVILEIISTIGLASGLISHALLLNITPRVLATKCRATLFGCYYSLGHLGTMTAYLITTQDIRDLTMMIVVVVITLILIFICLILPDVDGRELPDTLKDMDYFSE
ncbi:unnamed protein product [Pieris brassicae]|uniref:Uncharacterized protein n=1 Tax=Pieris brassicae TaxID=7116 RepID=A0A9P0TM69_PIEBR|nr:unnamed protein product [Pieris brassicae]